MFKKTMLFSIVCMSIIFMGCTQQTSEAETPSYTDITSAEAKLLYDTTSELVILDVAPASDYTAGHISNAVHIYVGELESRLSELDSSKPVLVYCRTASSSIQAAQILIDAGFETVYRLSDNYSGWVNAGYPVVTPEEQPQQNETSAEPEPAPEPEPVPEGTPQSASVLIQNYEYMPSELHIEVGATVTWTNLDNIQHTVTSDSGLFDSGLMSNGAIFSYAFGEAGTYTYHCTPHPYMTASIIVG